MALMNSTLCALSRVQGGIRSLVLGAKIGVQLAVSTITWYLQALDLSFALDLIKGTDWLRTRFGRRVG